MSRKKPDEGGAQLRIPFTRDARLRLLAEINPAIANVSRRTWINVAELLMQIELTTGADGCFCYCETLGDRMFERRGIPRSTFFRVRQTAGRLGLLIAEERHNRQGKMSNAWRVDWTVVEALAVRSGYRLTSETPGASAELSEGPKGGTDRSQSGTGRCQFGTDRSQSGTMLNKGFNLALIRPLINSSRSTVDNAVDQICEGEKAGDGVEGAGRVRPVGPAIERPNEARALAERLADRLGGCKSVRDWQLAAKCAILARSLGEQWLHGSVEGVVRRREIIAREGGRLANPWAYFVRVLREETGKRGKFLNRELARITLPPELATWRGGPAWLANGRLVSNQTEPTP